MDTQLCDNCNTPALEQAIFCHHCGNQLKCSQCQSPLIAGANNCIACGTEVSTARLESGKKINQIKFRENKDERWYEINFTNDVGKEIKEVVADLLKNKIGKKENSPLLVEHETKASEQFFKEEKYEPVAAAQDPEFISGTRPDFQPNHETTLAYPHLNDLDIRLTCTENEWLLIFAFYKSELGTTTFSKEPVWQLYKEKRLTETRFKNLGTNWKSLFKKYLSTVKENEFKFTAQGLAKVKNLLLPDKDTLTAGRLPRKNKNKIGNSLQSGRPISTSKKVVPHNLSPDEFDVYKNDLKISLEEFFNQKNQAPVTLIE